MPELEVTQEQLDRLDAVRDHLAAEVVGKYATVQRRDALEYLLDHYADETDGDEGGPAVDPDAVDAGHPSADEDEDETDDEATAADDGAVAAETGTTDDAGDEAEVDADAATTTTSSAPTPTPGDDGGSRLNSMMSLLEDHDDVWGEASGGEERYEVELPDGSTERARTKDDVRALLFKHYR
jgi:hypothetical protein